MSVCERERGKDFPILPPLFLLLLTRTFNFFLSGWWWCQRYFFSSSFLPAEVMEWGNELFLLWGKKLSHQQRLLEVVALAFWLFSSCCWHKVQLSPKLDIFFFLGVCRRLLSTPNFAAKVKYLPRNTVYFEVATSLKCPSTSVQCVHLHFEVFFKIIVSILCKKNPSPLRRSLSRVCSCFAATFAHLSRGRERGSLTHTHTPPKKAHMECRCTAECPFPPSQECHKKFDIFLLNLFFFW